MTTKILPPQEYLRECFDYDPATGTLRWRVRPEAHFTTLHAARSCNTRHAGRVIETVNGRGYLQVGLDFRLYTAHRIIWKLMTGEDPPEIDHRNVDPIDNRWENLRIATTKENLRNRGVNANSKLGIKGVWFDAGRNRYVASVGVNGHHIRLGRFRTLEEAKAAYDDAARHYHGEFYHH